MALGNESKKKNLNWKSENILNLLISSLNKLFNMQKLTFNKIIHPYTSKILWEMLIHLFFTSLFIHSITSFNFSISYPHTMLTFAVIYDETDCTRSINDLFEGYVNSTDVDTNKLDYVKKHNLSLDCMFIITVEEGWMVN